MWKVVVAGLATLAVLLVVGAIIQKTLPEPIPRDKTVALPRSVATATAVMTESDRASDNSPLWWVNRRGQRITLHSYDPNFVPPRTAATHMSLPGSFDRVQYAIGAWPPLRAAALFVMRQEPRFLTILIKSTATGKTVGLFHSPIPAPVPGVHRDLAITTYSGLKPDLYAIDRGSSRARVTVTAVSGESRFKRRLVYASLPFRGAGPREWAVIVGPVAAQKVDEPVQEKIPLRPDLMLVEHDPDHENSIVRLLLGENGFEGFAAQRAMDAPGDLPWRRVHFLLGSSQGATSIYLVETDRRGRSTLSIYSLQPLTGLF